MSITDDATYEPLETLEVVIDAGSLVYIAEKDSELSAEVAIEDDDFPVLNLNQASVSIDEGAGEVVIDYTITPANAYHEVSFRWSTPGQSAREDIDYRNRYDTEERVPLGGDGRGVLRIPIIDDGLDENDENFLVRIDSDSLENLVLGTSVVESTVTLIDDDMAPSIRVSDLTVEESAGTAEVTYHLSAASGRDVSFDWSTVSAGGTATDGSDFTAVSAETHTIPAGEVTGTLSVVIIDDEDDENNEIFKVEIDRSTLVGISAIGTDSSAEVTIVDRPFIKIRDARVDENDGAVLVRYALSSPTTATVQFNWSTRDITSGATGGTDYTIKSAESATLAPGGVEGILSIEITDDITFEDREAFEVFIDASSLQGIEDDSGSDLVATVVIVDEEDMVCADNFVKVPPMKGYSENSFCMAKYEMRDDGAGTAASTPEGSPWINMERADAVSACQAGSYELATNGQWQAVARNIELVGTNWHGQVVGSPGGLSRGHSDGFPANVLSAHSDDNQGCFQTGQDCSATTWSVQRRTHLLSNGEVIWDMAGNAWEWVADDNDVSYGENDYISQVTGFTHQVLSVLGSEGQARNAKGQFGPAGDYLDLDSENFGGLGYGYLNIFVDEDEDPLVTDKRVGVLRGGGLSDHVEAGIFASSLGINVEDTTTGVKGFRCAYRPTP